MNDTRSVSLQAGDNSQQIGVVHGDVNYYLYYGSPRAGDDHVDLDWYRTSIQNRFSEWKSKYTLLDLNPVVSVLGNDWKSIDGAEMTLKETIARSQRLVLLGGAGSGKTTSLRFLAYSITSDPESLSVGNHDEPNVCLLIDLTRFRLQQGLAPVQLILVLIGEVLHASSQANPPSLAAIHRLLSDQQHLILFFDGLNEVPFDAKLSCWNGIADLAQKYPRHRFVVTTRPYGFRPREGWNMAELQALKREQIPDFLTRYIDSATAFSLARVLQDNPLARVPLFLDYVAKLSQTGTFLGPTVNSKSGLIGSYVDRLISRDTPDSAKPSYFEDTSVLQSALISLAERANTSGQSIAFNVAVMLLERTEQVDRDTATNIIEELLVRTVLVRDGQYIRFWHQTIQEHFFAASVVKIWRSGHKEGLIGNRSIRSIFMKAKEYGSLLSIPYFLTDQELYAATMKCLSWNPALCLAWLDDLSFEQRSPKLVSDVVAILRRKLLAACRYSRLGGPGGRVIVAFLYLYLVLGLFSALGQLIVGPVLFLIGAFGAVVVSLGVLFVDMLRSPTRQTVDQILLPAFGIRHVGLRGAFVSIADEIARSPLTAFAQRSVAMSFAKTSAEDDALTLLRNSPSLLAAIRILGRLSDDKALPILQFCLDCKNVLAEEALRSLRERAALFSRERDQISTIALEIYNDPDAEWRFIKGAKKCVLASTSIVLPRVSRWARFNRPTRREFLHRTSRAFIAFVCVTLLYAAIPMTGMRLRVRMKPTAEMLQGDDIGKRQVDTQRRDEIRRREFALMLFASLYLLAAGTFLFFGVKRVAKGAEGVHPWSWAFSAMCFYISIPAFYFNKEQMRKDAAPFDRDALERYLAERSA